MPFFSVIIPTYNRSDKIFNLLKSLEKQIFKDFEIIIVDDGSVDNTKEIVHSFQSILDIKYFYIENWGGPAKPRNIGLQNSSSSWIIFIDSDDGCLKNKLLEYYNHINKFPSIDFWFHKMNLINELGVKKGTTGNYSPNNKPLENFKKILYYGNKIPLSSICVKKERINEINGFTEDKNFIAIEDLDFNLKLSLLNINFGKINKILGNYYFSEDSISKDSLNQIQKFELLQKEYLNNYSFIDKKKLYAINCYKKGVSFLNFDKKKSRYFFIQTLKSTSNLELILKSLIRLI